MQADWALGLKKEKPARKSLPAWNQSTRIEVLGA
jgi:hypothetical protein